MAKRDKLLEKARNAPQNLIFQDFQTLAAR